MGLCEIAGNDGAVHCAYDFAERDLLCWAGQQIAAAYASLGDHQPSAFERQQNLLQVRLRQTGALRYVAGGGGGAFRMQRQRQQGATGIIASRGDFHADCSVAVMPVAVMPVFVTASRSIFFNTAFGNFSCLTLPMLDGLAA